MLVLLDVSPGDSLTVAVTLAGWSCADPRCLLDRCGPESSAALACAARVHLERVAARVNPGVEIGVNPDSRPWADAPEGCRAAR